MAGGIDITRAGTDEALDILKITQRAYPHRGELEVLQQRHKYPVMNQWFSHTKEQNGADINFLVMIDEGGQCEFALPYEEEETADVPSVMERVTLPWRHAKEKYVLNRKEVLMNANQPDPGVQLIEMLKPRRAHADLRIANGLETRAWITPPTTTDRRYPMGIPYFLPPITAAQVAAHVAAGTNTGQHQGQNPIAQDGNTFSDCMGLDASDADYEMWRSYNDVWTNEDPDITEDDVDKLIRMHRHLGFEVPMNARDWEKGTMSNYQGYTTEQRIAAMDKKARDNNDSLQADLGKYAGQVVVKGTPFQWVEDLDDVGTDPLFMLDHDHFYPVVLPGEKFREDDPLRYARNHNTLITWIDCSFNFVCDNRRQAGGRIDWVEAA